MHRIRHGSRYQKPEVSVLGSFKQSETEFRSDFNPRRNADRSSLTKHTGADVSQGGNGKVGELDPFSIEHERFSQLSTSSASSTSLFYASRTHGLTRLQQFDDLDEGELAKMIQSEDSDQSTTTTPLNPDVGSQTI
jgi:hypothetical protein